LTGRQACLGVLRISEFAATEPGIFRRRAESLGLGMKVPSESRGKAPIGYLEMKNREAVKSMNILNVFL